MVHGSCLCGAIGYEVEPPFGVMTHCHCSMCRKAHGAAFATCVGAQVEHFRWTRGEGVQGRYHSSENVDRVFCRTCGSSLLFLWLPSPDRVWIAVGTFDVDPGCRPEAHIFVASKAPWFSITDTLPQHAEDREP